MIFLSFIIPHYNLPRQLLTRCIDSIISQNMPKDSYEIIIIDDGSQTVPYSLIDIYKTENLKIISTRHSGPGGARNRGLDEASGKYIQFIDADDYLQPQALNDCIEILHTERPKILRFKYNICHNDKQHKPVAKKKNIKYGTTISGAAFMMNNNLSGCPWDYIFERETAIKNNIHFATNVYHEDEEFNTKLHYHATSLIVCNIPVYNYCIRSGSITSNSNSDFEKKRIEDLFSLLERLTKFRAQTDEKANPIQKKGLSRKLTMLTVDVILNLFYNKRTAHEIHSLCKERISPLGLYPLPPKSYSLKYRIFRILANNILGLTILRLLLPNRKPQKK